MKDFFISYNRADEKWAEWIAWHLEEAGYAVVIQAWDSQFGKNFIEWMDEASKTSERTIAVLSQTYFTGRFAKDEWTAAFYKNKLLPIRIQNFEIEGLLGPIAYIDLVGLDEDRAREKLLQDNKVERKKPLSAPAYPGEKKHTVSQPKRFPGALPPIWNVPDRNPNFTGRKEYLEDIRQALTSGNPAALTQTQAISGLGGVGKTQIALEYAYRYMAHYDVVWWVGAETETLSANYAAFARAKDLPEKDAQEREVVIDAVRRWFGQNKGWLLIFDNAKGPEDIRPYLPKVATGHMLITSRHQSWRGVANPIAVKQWPREESIAFLCKRTGQDDKTGADVLAQALGDLPLALAQAAAYMEERSKTFDNYLKLYASRRKELWAKEKPPQDYPETVGTTWDLAIEEVKKDAPAGMDILALCAYLAPDDIPRRAFSEANEFLPETLRDELAVDDGFEALRRYSLIELTSERLSLHRLVQAVVQDMLDKTEKQDFWIETAVATIAGLWPQGTFDVRSWPECERMMPHSTACVRHAEKHEIESTVLAALLNGMGFYLHARAVYGEAEPLFRRALAIREAQLGKDHPDVAQSLNNLTGLLQAQGKYMEAEPLLRRALAITEAQLGKDHPVVATSLNNLAGLLRDQGKYTEAEPLLRRALAIYEAQLGKDHPNTVMVQENLKILVDEMRRTNG